MWQTERATSCGRIQRERETRIERQTEAEQTGEDCFKLKWICGHELSCIAVMVIFPSLAQPKAAQPLLTPSLVHYI